MILNVKKLIKIKDIWTIRIKGRVDIEHNQEVRQMTSEAAKDIVEKFVSHFQLRIVIMFVYSVNPLDKYMCSIQDSLEEQASQGSFVPHGHQEVLTAAIGQLEHPGHVCPARAGVTIKQYFVAHQCGCG